MSTLWLTNALYIAIAAISYRQAKNKVNLNHFHYLCALAIYCNVISITTSTEYNQVITLTCIIATATLCWSIFHHSIAKTKWPFLIIATIAITDLVLSLSNNILTNIHLATVILLNSALILTTLQASNLLLQDYRLQHGKPPAVASPSIEVLENQLVKTAKVGLVLVCIIFLTGIKAITANNHDYNSWLKVIVTLLVFVMLLVPILGKEKKYLSKSKLCLVFFISIILSAMIYISCIYLR